MSFIVSYHSAVRCMCGYTPGSSDLYQDGDGQKCQNVAQSI